MHLNTTAILLSVRPHGEHGAVVRVLTEHAGVQPGYVRGGRSRAIRPVLQPGNLIRGDWRARTDTQLAALTVELVESRAPLFAEPLAAAAIDWMCALTAYALPEAQPYPRIHAALDGLFAAIAAAPGARDWVGALVRTELLILSELGFGLSLDECVATGVTDDLTHVSPKSGGAVSRAAAVGLEHRLLPLPAFLIEGGRADWAAAFDGLTLSGHFLSRDLLGLKGQDVLAARTRLVERLKRTVA
ncbi:MULTISPECIES: DNA repair protein RecO [Sphingomonas]|jgi:DNA repair protein RecO (recombination protein O)|uniref:DNA repair protein RecO n=1 Tax=Sphingomonas hankookensis TaxID=563996 RepID=A0ABR5Y8U3_9SPHN|nr:MULTISPECIES: DNA repair protein RecO [Sphingomonas]KZE10959.1 DNA repair protein RecO [Sphingomonas hankookensis]PZT91908.1 MAG: DNA repair protein RecO [Sphingomonas sp.]RSV31536.1 DNA repair protein RecO [Sphingomonas sp. ABOLH]WCP71629.1 DNA repair protein RecO [Sphingomonas hankookensis]